jgi:Co/Zn/Cd efflux system component
MRDNLDKHSHYRQKQKVTTQSSATQDKLILSSPICENIPARIRTSHDQKNQSGLGLSLSNITLIIMKIFAGILSGSVSIISEAIHSAMDLVAALIALVAVRKSDIPPTNATPTVMTKLKTSPA